jgi:broad specificity phosphatase PhoE
MARIILMRHGQPEFDFDGAYGRWISAEAMCELIDGYTETSLVQPQYPPDRTKHLAQSAHYAISSPLPRAIESLLALRLNIEFATDPVFAEVPMARLVLPSFLRKLPLPVIVWSVLSRVLWWLGLANGEESYKASMLRARIALGKLEAAVEHHNTILLSGHGFFNHMLGKQLKQLGWREQSDMVKGSGAHKYWTCKIFDKVLPEQET